MAEAERLGSLVSLGREDRYLEFKESRPWDDLKPKLCRTAMAMANIMGGTFPGTVDTILPPMREDYRHHDRMLLVPDAEGVLAKIAEAELAGDPQIAADRARALLALLMVAGRRDHRGRASRCVTHALRRAGGSR